MATRRPEVLIVGAGPGGISTALWLDGLDVAFRWICRDTTVGGTLRRVGNPIYNYPGVPAAQGHLIVDSLENQLAEAELFPEFSMMLSYLDRNGDGFAATIEGANGSSHVEQFAAVVIATGTQPRLLNLEGESPLLGDGVEISVTRTKERYEGMDVAVVGGGDAALEGALVLRGCANHIYLIHRRENFRAQRRFVDEVERSAEIEVIRNAEVVALATDNEGRLAHVTLDDGRSLSVGGLFERIGVAPCVPSGIAESLASSGGYLDVNRDGETEIPGLFAVGDVANRAHQSVAWAAGTGGAAATAIQKFLGQTSS